MIDYKTRIEKVTFGDLNLEIEMVEDLDQAIDQICEELDKKGKSEDLFAADMCPYFGILWPSGVALAEHISRMGTWMKEKTVLELGCGLGLPSIVAAKRGAKVTACDFHPDVKVFLQKNAAKNNVEIDYIEKHWEQDADQNPQKTSNDVTYDFVIASDVLYESSHPASMAKALKFYCKKQGHILLSDPGRTYLQAFTKELENEGFRHDLFIKDAYGFNRNGVREEKQVFLLTFQR